MSSVKPKKLKQTAIHFHFYEVENTNFVCAHKYSNTRCWSCDHNRNRLSNPNPAFVVLNESLLKQSD